jgi:cyanophycin synthetase
MNFLKILALRGPNLWARFPVLEAWLDLGLLKNVASSEIAGFNDRLKTMLPSLAEHHCSEGHAGGFYERLERGTYLAHILEHVAIELQSLAGTPVKFGKTRMTGTDGVYKVAVRYLDEDLGRAALEQARQLVLAAVHDTPFDVAASVAGLTAICSTNRQSPLTEAVLAAAKERRVPARVIDKSGLLQLGTGSKQRRVLEGQTDATSAVAVGIAHDRTLTSEMLAAIGVPVPYGRVATNGDDACAAAKSAELPVVIRPKFGVHPPASDPCGDEAAVRAAYAHLADQGYTVLVEHATPGRPIRMLIIGGKLIATIRNDGDRWHPVDVHPRIADRALDAVSVMGLDVAVVDAIALDPNRPLEEQAGTIVAVQSQPDFTAFERAAGLVPADQHPANRLDLVGGDKPRRSSTQDIGLAVVDHLFPNPDASRIPVIAVTGTNGKTTTTRLTSHLLGRDRTVGMCCTEGIYLGDRRIMTGDCSGPKSAKILLNHAAVDAAVVETARGGILREGLGFDRCDVAIVTNIGDGDHLGTNDVDTPAQLANVKSTIVWAVRENGYAVLNATDPLVVDMVKWCAGGVIFFAQDEQHPVLAQHRSCGGRTAFVRNNAIFLAIGPEATELVSLLQVPLTHGGLVGFHVENALASAAAAWAVGMPFNLIRQGLESFAPRMDQVPARFNVMDIHGVTVVLDYGHNTSAVARLLEVIDRFPHPRKSVVYSAAGDRRDQDIVDQGRQLGAAFDRVFIYEDTYLRGRREGEITELFRQGMASTRRVKDIRSIQGGMLAIEIALAACLPGDLLVIQPDRIDDGVALLRKFMDEGGEEIPLAEALRCLKPAPDADGASGEYSTDVVILEGRLGKQAVAARAFRRGEVVTEGFGPTTTERSMHTIQIDSDLHLVPPSPMKFFNHSCEPNCGLLIRCGVDNLEIHALRDLVAGEELTLDYETFEEEFEALTGPCLCRSPKCRGRLRGYGTMSDELREKYGIYIAEYLQLADEPLTVTTPLHHEAVGHPAEIPVAAEV